MSMRAFIVFASLLICAFCASGCFPFPQHITFRPGVTGAVVDSETGSPMPGVKVAFYWRDFDTTEPSSPADDKPEVVAFSGSDGRFELPAEQRWICSYMFIYLHPIPYGLSFTRPGYDRVFVDEFFQGQDAVNVGKISLKRATSTSPSGWRHQRAVGD
ncbi:MAG TPA: carboxypeptidase-like regulatory domain-containing protein [Tepidisphaeraceae bacterium]|nr:carboxypeptidase-like regulatory domain-containing protein [Tepidisphaeraceae bacterium]